MGLKVGGPNHHHRGVLFFWMFCWYLKINSLEDFVVSEISTPDQEEETPLLLLASSTSQSSLTPTLKPTHPQPTPPPKHHQHVAHLHHVRTPVQANLHLLDPDPQRRAPLAARLGQARPEHDAPLALAVGLGRRRQALHGRRQQQQPPVVAGLVAAGVGVDLAASLGWTGVQFLRRYGVEVKLKKRFWIHDFAPLPRGKADDETKRHITTLLDIPPARLHTNQQTHQPVNTTRYLRTLRPGTARARGGRPSHLHPPAKPHLQTKLRTGTDDHPEIYSAPLRPNSNERRCRCRSSRGKMGAWEKHTIASHNVVTPREIRHIPQEWRSRLPAPTRQPIQPPPASAVSTASARSHHPPRIAPWGLGKTAHFIWQPLIWAAGPRHTPNQLPTQAVPNRRHSSPGEDRRAPGSPPRIAPGRAGLWRPDCGSSPAPASPGPLMRMSASFSPPTSFSSSSSSFCAIKAIFCDGFQTFCIPFFFCSIYLHVTCNGCRR